MEFAMILAMSVVSVIMVLLTFKWLKRLFVFLPLIFLITFQTLLIEVCEFGNEVSPWISSDCVECSAGFGF
jgi:hypothetical protein